MISIESLNSYIDQNKIILKLQPVFVGELYLARKLKHPVYIFEDGLFNPAIEADSSPSREQIVNLTKKNHKEVYVYGEDALVIKKNLQLALLKVTRSLSVGDPLENGSKEIKLLSLNLGELYANPHSDELLMLQLQSSQNLSKFLLENKKYQSSLFQSLAKENFHFTLTQPMLSSMLLLSFLQSIHLFSDREIENLFLASYLKDIGFSMIPSDKYDLNTLSRRDKELFADHADFSFDLLQGRIPLSSSYLNIIKNHHFLNDKMKDIILKNPNHRQETEMIYGIESTLVSVFDMIVAMTSYRPYRKGMSLFQAMEIIKKSMADDYPQEFKALVIFFRQFFKN
jgi:response regulator RpfG family c-di-GMP phosphodiesterase